MFTNPIILIHELKNDPNKPGEKFDQDKEFFILFRSKKVTGYILKINMHKMIR
jgi:hypothetical protein